jgi:hypothetical protein
MSNGNFAPRSDDLEFQEATPEQIGRIGTLASEVLDGAITLAGRRQVFSTQYFESEFFHQWLARYVHGDAAMEPVSAEEAEQLLEDHEHPVTAFPERFRHNQVGLALGLASGVAYDGGYLEFSAPIEGTDVSYDIRLDALVGSDMDAFIRQVHGMPQDASERQAQVLLDIAKLLAMLDETGSPEPLERATSVRIRDRFNGFPVEDDEETVVEPETAAALKTRLLDVVDQRSIKATFLRKFEGTTGTSMVTLNLKLGRDGNYSRWHEVQIRVPSNIGGFDSFVTKLAWADGSELAHSEYFDVDLNRMIERKEAEDPDFSFVDSAEALLGSAMNRRREQQQRFEEEKREGFHVFSQADANRIIRTLEAPGEEVTY